MQNQESLKIPIQSTTEAQVIFGQSDAFLNIVEARFNVKVLLKSEGLEITGKNFDDVKRVTKTFESLLHLIRSGQSINANDVKYAIRTSKENAPVQLEKAANEAISVFSKRGVVRPKTLPSSAM